MRKRSGRKRTVAPRMRRVRQMWKDLAFDLTTSDPNAELGVSQVAGELGEDMHMELRFQPPITRAHGANSYITIVHLPTKRQDNQICVLPTTEIKEMRQFPDDEQVYLTFPSHAARMSWPDGLLVQCVYVKLVNIQLQGNVDAPIYTIEMQPPVHERYSRLEYFPPIPLEKTPIDASKYPQGLPLTFKPKTGETSSRVAKKIGYYAGPDNFNQWKRAAMRFGRSNELVAVFSYLEMFPRRVYYETGYHECPDGAAQPDGLVEDVDAKPLESEAYRHLESTQGLIEIKCSTTNCNFEGPHIAQAIWEMMAANVGWCDLVRYCKRPVKNDNKWADRRSMRVIRLYRDKTKEDQLRDCVLHKNDQQCAALRNELDKMAHTANTDPSLSTEVELDDSVPEMILRYRRDYFEKHKMEVDIVDEALDRIDKRQAVIFSLYQDNDSGNALKNQVAEQIQDLANLIKHE